MYSKNITPPLPKEMFASPIPKEMTTSPIPKEMTTSPIPKEMITSPLLKEMITSYAIEMIAVCDAYGIYDSYRKPEFRAIYGSDLGHQFVSILIRCPALHPYLDLTFLLDESLEKEHLNKIYYLDPILFWYLDVPHRSKISGTTYLKHGGYAVIVKNEENETVDAIKIFRQNHSMNSYLPLTVMKLLEKDFPDFICPVIDSYVIPKNIIPIEFVEKMKCCWSTVQKKALVITTPLGVYDASVYLKQRSIDGDDIESWRIILFKIVYILAKIQKKWPGFRHNDCKLNNFILYRRENVSETLELNGTTYCLPPFHFDIKMNDFDLTTIVDSTKDVMTNYLSTSLGIGQQQNRYYDAHFLFNTCLERTKNDKPVNDFLRRNILGARLDTVNNRLVSNTEYLLPEQILRDEFFTPYRLRSQPERCPEILRSQPERCPEIFHSFLKTSGRVINDDNTTVLLEPFETVSLQIFDSCQTKFKHFGALIFGSKWKQIHKNPWFSIPSKSGSHNKFRTPFMKLYQLIERRDMNHFLDNYLKLNPLITNHFQIITKKRFPYFGRLQLQFILQMSSINTFFNNKSFNCNSSRFGNHFKLSSFVAEIVYNVKKRLFSSEINDGFYEFLQKMYEQKHPRVIPYIEAHRDQLDSKRLKQFMKERRNYHDVVLDDSLLDELVDTDDEMYLEEQLRHIVKVPQNIRFLHTKKGSVDGKKRLIVDSCLFESSLQKLEDENFDDELVKVGAIPNKGFPIFVNYTHQIIRDIHKYHFGVTTYHTEYHCQYRKMLLRDIKEMLGHGNTNTSKLEYVVMISNQCSRSEIEYIENYPVESSDDLYTLRYLIKNKQIKPPNNKHVADEKTFWEMFQKNYRVETELISQIKSSQFVEQIQELYRQTNQALPNLSLDILISRVMKQKGIDKKRRYDGIVWLGIVRKV